MSAIENPTPEDIDEARSRPEWTAFEEWCYQNNVDVDGPSDKWWLWFDCFASGVESTYD